MRTTIVSTSKIKTYKIFVMSIVSMVTILFVGGPVYRWIFYGEFNSILTVPIYIWLAYKTIPAILRIKNVSYDHSSVYYDKKGFEVQIPFEDIKDIEIKTISGIYKLNLYDPSQDGSSILFKTSLWYPFNFKKQDEKVNELRGKIDKYKQILSERDIVELPSIRI